MTIFGQCYNVLKNETKYPSGCGVVAGSKHLDILESILSIVIESKKN